MNNVHEHSAACTSLHERRSRAYTPCCVGRDLVTMVSTRLWRAVASADTTLNLLSRAPSPASSARRLTGSDQGRAPFSLDDRLADTGVDGHFSSAELSGISVESCERARESANPARPSRGRGHARASRACRISAPSSSAVQPWARWTGSVLLHSRDIFESFECAMDPVTELPLRKGGRTSSDGQRFNPN
ncbi:hypothetical protein OH76DRAFT_252040 [Lentinus brumalis]|uniref:Uncharacterized protein n=1 Tax=Lentinus brumalis TaxID=2498619 RepID=A0A371CLG4_9APHY|nr:hypothetical protein OH76DRAFT_252040 [Polyporus brumalis]